jgi:UPF0042 nucleotide-binding protein
MRLIIISGRSGSGKSTALHQLEDEGFYCIDNLPAALLPSLVNQALESGSSEYQQIAVCIDARNAWKDLHDFPLLLTALSAEVRVDILYLDADDGTLIKRYSETRRRHPLSNATTPLADAIVRELTILQPIANVASLAINSSDMTIYELRNLIRQRFTGHLVADVSLLFQSFGYKKGLPTDADLVFDVRIMPNPHWIQALRSKSGLDQAVVDFLENQPIVEDIYNDISNFLEKWLPRYRDNNRSYITIALGCTGGQHRSVYLTERLHRDFSSGELDTHIRHRDLYC